MSRSPRTPSTLTRRWRQLSMLPLALAAIGLAVPIVSIQPTEPVSAAEHQQVLQTLTVTGQGIERISTTLTLVRLGVEVQGKTAADVQAKVARQSSAVVTLLQQNNVEKLQTTGIRLTPNYTYNDRVQRLVGYTGTNTVSFRIPTSQVGSLIDRAVQAGATRIDGISFTATDEAIEEAKQEALRQATANAQKQAQTVLDSLNLTSRGIVSIQIDRASAPPPLIVNQPQFARAESDAIATTPIIGGEQEVSASVTLQIRY